MMIKLLSLFIIVSCFAFPAEAQDDTQNAADIDEESQDTVFKVRKNEVGINLAHMFVFLLGGQNDIQIEFGYKRYLTEHKALRLNAGYLQSGKYLLFKQNIDTLSNLTEDKKLLEGSIGLEWHKYMNSILVFAGSDLTFSNYHSTNSYEVFIKDTANSNGSYILTSNLTVRDSYRYGMKPFLGMIYPLSPRLSLSVQTALILYYEIGNFKNIINNVSVERSFEQFIFSYGPILSNVSINLKF